MQLGTDLVILSTLTTVLVSTTVGLYLLRLWYKQSNRLITDLPLVFAITTISHACQVTVLALQNLGVIEASLEFLRLRSFIISGSIIPVIGAILQIWAPRIQKYHVRILAIIAIYWWSIALFGFSEAFIMNATIPFILVAGVIMFATFTITWKTGRLKEIRSDMMIIGIPPAMASQLLRVPLLNTSLFYIPDVLLMLSLVITGLAFFIPSRKSGEMKKEQSPQAQELTMSVEY